jgi:hypothetical protein
MATAHPIRHLITETTTGTVRPRVPREVRDEVCRYATRRREEGAPWATRPAAPPLGTTVRSASAHEAARSTTLLRGPWEAPVPGVPGRSKTHLVATPPMRGYGSSTYDWPLRRQTLHLPSPGASVTVDEAGVSTDDRPINVTRAERPPKPRRRRHLIPAISRRHEIGATHRVLILRMTVTRDEFGRRYIGRRDN